MRLVPVMHDQVFSVNETKRLCVAESVDPMADETLAAGAASILVLVEQAAAQAVETRSGHIERLPRLFKCASIRASCNVLLKPVSGVFD
jgi:hypothetical protein